jgi:GT2 family glycosyltransferase
MSSPLVGIVVLNYNGTAETLECLRSLSQTTYRPVRLYLVDNGSKVPMEEEARTAYPDVIYIQNQTNVGFTGGNNVGCRRALADGCRYILMLNNDTIVERDFLEPLVRAIESDPTLGAVTPKIYFYDSEREIWGIGARIGRWTGRSPHWGVYTRDQGQWDHIQDVDRITGCAMFVRREILESVGLLDERFFIYEEELEWCHRVRSRGHQLRVIHESRIWHKGHRDSGRIGRPFITYLQTRNHLLVLRLHGGQYVLDGIVALLYAMAVALHGFWKALISCSRAGVGAIWEGWRDAILGRFGPPLKYLR